MALSPEERVELREGVEEMLDWLTFHSGYLAGWKAAGGDVSNLDVLRQVTRDADKAYREHVAERSA